MGIIELIFALIEKFVPVSPVKLTGLRRDADKWESDLIGKEEEKQNAVEKQYVKYSKMWWFQLLLAVLYIPLFKWLAELMNPQTSELDLDSE